jgi:stage III sporulation protein AD
MDILKIVGFVVVCIFMIFIFKSHRPEYALFIEMMAGVLIFLMVADKLKDLLQVIDTLAKSVHFDKKYLEILFKIVGISYVGELGMGFCQDAGHSALGKKIELSVKIMLLLVALPIVSALIDVLQGILK